MSEDGKTKAVQKGLEAYAKEMGVSADSLGHFLPPIQYRALLNAIVAACEQHGNEIAARIGI